MPPWIFLLLSMFIYMLLHIHRFTQRIKHHDDFANDDQNSNCDNVKMTLEGNFRFNHEWLWKINMKDLILPLWSIRNIVLKIQSGIVTFLLFNHYFSVSLTLKERGYIQKVCLQSLSIHADVFQWKDQSFHLSLKTVLLGLCLFAHTQFIAWHSTQCEFWMEPIIF